VEQYILGLLRYVLFFAIGDPFVIVLEVAIAVIETCT
jgi:hypothetical protein